MGKGEEGRGRDRKPNFVACSARIVSGLVMVMVDWFLFRTGWKHIF